MQTHTMEHHRSHPPQLPTATGKKHPAYN